MLKIGDKIISLEFDKVSMQYRAERIKVAKIEIVAGGVFYYTHDVDYIGGHDMYRDIYKRIEGRCFETEEEACNYLKATYTELINEFQNKIDLCKCELSKLLLTKTIDQGPDKDNRIR